MLVVYLIGVILVFWLIRNDSRVRLPLLVSLLWPLAIPLMIISFLFLGIAAVFGGNEEKEIIIDAERASRDRERLMSAIRDGANVTNFDTSNIVNFGCLFADKDGFNQDISGWNVSNGTDFSGMFYNATSFNQDISGWDVSNGTSFSAMFGGATSFNQDISGWGVPSAEEWGDFRTGSPLTDENTPSKFL